MKLRKFLPLLILIPGIVAFLPTIREAMFNTAQSDFTTYYWASKWATTLPFKHPYSNLAPLFPFFYPPAALIFFRPLSFLPYQKAVAVFSIISFTAFVIGYRLSCDSLKKVGLPIPLWMQSAFFFSLAFWHPVQFTFLAGQANGLIFFFVSSAFYCYLQGGHKGRSYKPDITAGFLLALAAILKITPALLLIFFLFRGRSKIFLSGIFFILAFSLGAEYLVQWDQSINWYYLRRVVHHVSDQGESIYRDQSVLSLIMIWRGYLDSFYSNYLEQYFGEFLSGRRFYSAVSYIAAGLGILFPLISAPLSSTNRRFDSSVITDYSALLLVGVVGSGLAWFHQYTILIFSFLVGLGLVLKMRSGFLKLLFVLFLAGTGVVWGYNWEPFTYNHGFSPWYLSSIMLFGAFVLYFILLAPRWGIEKVFDKSARLRLRS